MLNHKTNNTTMRVTNLSRNQLCELKQAYYMHVLREDIGVSYDELANINAIVSDDEVIDYYVSTHFVDDDFFSNN